MGNVIAFEPKKGAPTPTREDWPFKGGSLVALNSGGCFMTVAWCSKEKAPDGLEEWIVHCTWHDEADCLWETDFSAITLYEKPVARKPILTVREKRNGKQNSKPG